MARQEATNIVGTVYKITNIVNNKIYIGYNSDSGGLGGRIPNEQTRKKERIAKLKDPNIKKRMAYARSFQDHKKSICQYNYYTGELINRFESIKEASEKLHLDDSCIVKCCKYPAKSKYLRIEKIKYTFRYENEIYIPKYRFKMTLEDGSFVDYLVDTIHCEEKYHVDISQIIRCCTNKNKYAGKFNNLKMYWSYV